MFRVHWNNKKIRFCLLNGLLTAFFAFLMVFGKSFAEYWNWNSVFEAPIYSAASFLCWWAFFFLTSYALGKPLVLGTDHRKGIASLGKWGNWFCDRLKDEKQFRKVFFCVWAFMALLWLPYLIGFYPGIANADVAEQLAMSFNFDNVWFEKVERPLSMEVKNCGHHPVFNTWMQGLFVRIGILLGSQNLGVFLHTVLLMAFTTGVFSWSICYMAYRGVSFGKCLALFLMFGLIPSFPLYGINLVKNSQYAAWTYLSVLLLFQMADDTERFCGKKKNRVFLFLSLLMQALNVKHGVHVIILTAVPLLICYRKKWKLLLPIFLLPILIVQVGVNGILMPALKISPGSAREAYGFMYQQTARYVRDYPQDVTEEERRVIDQILVYDDLARNYNPITSDSIKFDTYRKEQTEEDRRAYQKVWFQQLLKHPGVYVEATINGCYGFFYPGTDEWYNYYEFDRVIEQKGNGFFNIYHPEELRELKTEMTNLEAFIRELPVVKILFRHAAYVWVTLWCAMIFLASGRYKSFLAVLPLIGNILVCILSPYNANTRYLLPVIYGAGLCVLALFSLTRQEN